MKYSLLIILFIIQFNPVYPKALLEVSFSFYENENDVITLKAGLDTTATDSIDKNLGEYEMPPLPPLGSFDIRFKLKGTNGTLNDYRYIGISDPSIITKEYFVSAQLSGISNELRINYDITDAQEFVIVDQSGLPLNDVKTSGSGIVKIPADVNNFIIKVTYNNPLRITNFETEKLKKPADFYLSQNYPNPFNPSTTISYIVPVGTRRSASGGVFVQLKIYDILGKEVALIVNEEKPAGQYFIEFDAGKYNMTSGIYFCRMESGSFTQVRKFVILK